MSLPLIRVDVDYKPKLTKGELLLLAMPSRLRNLRPLMIRGIAPEFVKMITRHFQTAGRAFGHPWAPLMPATIRKKRKKGTLSRGILRDTGNLFDRLVAMRQADNRLRPIPGGLLFQANTSVKYAIFHQVGTQFMADRQVIPDPLPPSFISRIRAIIHDYILTGALPT